MFRLACRLEQRKTPQANRWKMQKGNCASGRCRLLRLLDTVYASASSPRRLWCLYRTDLGGGPQERRTARCRDSAGAHRGTAPVSAASGGAGALVGSRPSAWAATAHTTGSSRSGRTSATCWALSARSSSSTPPVLPAATFVMAETSSRMLVMSSSSASKPVATKRLRDGRAAPIVSGHSGTGSGSQPPLCGSK